MRRSILAAGLLLAWMGSGRAQTCQNLLEIDCPGGQPTDIVTVTATVSNCGQLFRAFGFDIVCDPAQLRFGGMETVGTLLDSWTRTGVNTEAGLLARLRVGGYDSVGFGQVESAPLVSLLFEVLVALPSSTSLEIDQASVVDDVYGFALVDGVKPVPVEGETWGHQVNI